MASTRLVLHTHIVGNYSMDILVHHLPLHEKKEVLSLIIFSSKLVFKKSSNHLTQNKSLGREYFLFGL